MNIFKFYPLEYKKLKGIDRKSKQFLREVALMQAKFSKHILGEFFHNKVDAAAVQSGKEYLLNVIMFSAYLIAAVAILAYSIFLLGNDISKEEMGAFVLLMSAVVLSFIAAFIFAGRSGKVRRDYLAYLFDSMPVRNYSFCEEMLEDVASAVLFSHKEYLSDGDKCVCFNCKTKFSADKVIIDDDGDLFCPVCELNTVLSEKSGYSLDDEFVDAMHEYWLQE